MGGYYINVNVKADCVGAVYQALVDTLAAEKFRLIQDDPAADVVDNDDCLPEGEDWYGLILSGHADNDWVTVYAADWKDCGLLARRISENLQSQVLEVWVADDVNWGYNYWQNGVVVDRFADDPRVLTVDAAEADLYFGSPAAVGPILEITDDAFAHMLAAARNNAGQFAGPSVGDLCTAVALPFEQAFTAYDYFFTDDPEDYAPDLPQWPQFRHLVFQHPDGRDRLTE
ncbi:MAG: hypothetical protein ACLQVD_22965 [Capsulimonadaceae bacterium]